MIRRPPRSTQSRSSAASDVYKRRTKRVTRAAAEAAGMPAAAEPESQEVCFAVDGYQRFLDERGVQPRAGAIVNRDGAVLGTHRGHWRYTIGQRRGLGLSSTEPLFVLARRWPIVYRPVSYTHL